MLTGGCPKRGRENTAVQNVTYTYDASGNRTGLTATGTESYAIEYTYDENNRLTDEDKLIGGVVSDYVLYFYDDNGNLLSRLDTAAGWDTYTYNNLNQLIAATAGGIMATYTYNTRGIRTGKCVEDTNTTFLLDGSNVAAEAENNAVSANYLWGANPIRADRASTVRYFVYNAHGDVVQLTDGTGTLQKSYAYDAFGNEKNPSSTDVNPFRYCGEYWDSETGTYYLRARYYDPAIGRFTQADTHWDVSNMIYGDNPQKINEREDALGLKTYTYVPEITAIMQAGNLYVYGLGNPVAFADHSGEAVINVVFAAIGAIAGWAFGDYVAKKLELTGAKYWTVRSAVTVGGAAIGWFAGSAISSLAKSFLMSHTAALSKMPTFVLKFLGIKFASSKFVENSYVLYNNTVGHIFSRSHVTDGIMSLGRDRIDIFNKLINTVNQYSAKFMAGSNEIRTVINGVQTTIRFYVRSGKIINLDAFVGYSNRVVGTLLTK